MTDDEALQFYNNMLGHFGTLPNFEHEHIQFANCVRMYKYYKEQYGRSETSSTE